MREYAGPTGNEPGRPRPEPIHQAIARITRDQPGLPTDEPRRRAVRGAAARRTSRAWRGTRSLLSSPRSWRAMRVALLAAAVLLVVWLVSTGRLVVGA